MRIAYLILAHTDVQQLNRLLKQLCAMQDVYLHIDEKAPFSQRDVALFPSLHILDQRMRCYWGDISLVEASLLLYRAAFHKNYDRYVLLSGQDYPLYAQKDLLAFFERYPNVEFIRGFPITSENPEYGKVQQRHFMKPLLHTEQADKIVRYLLRYAITKNRLCYKDPSLLVQGQEYVLYGGGQWHALTHAFVSYMMEFIDTHPSFTAYFKSAYAPDELFFQTIIFNSPFRNNTYAKGAEVAHVDDRNRWTALHMMKIDLHGQSGVMTLDDYLDLKKSGVLFFRKAASGRSDSLIDRLEEEFYAEGK